MWLSSKNKQNMTFPLKKQQQPHALTGNLSKTITIQLEDHFQIKLWASSQMQAHRWACARWATEQGPPKAWAPPRIPLPSIPSDSEVKTSNLSPVAAPSRIPSTPILSATSRAAVRLPVSHSVGQLQPPLFRKSQWLLSICLPTS